MPDSSPNLANTLTARVKDTLAAMSSGQLVKLENLFAKDLVYHLTGQHQFSGKYEGSQSVLDLLAGLRSSFRTGIHYSVSRLIAVNNTVVATFTGTGTTVTGNEYRNEYCAIWDFNDDQQVSHITEYFDSDHVAKVLSQQH